MQLCIASLSYGEKWRCMCLAPLIPTKKRARPGRLLGARCRFPQSVARDVAKQRRRIGGCVEALRAGGLTTYPLYLHARDAQGFLNRPGPTAYPRRLQRSAARSKKGIACSAFTAVWLLLHRCFYQCNGGVWRPGPPSSRLGDRSSRLINNYACPARSVAVCVRALPRTCVHQVQGNKLGHTACQTCSPAGVRVTSTHGREGEAPRKGRCRREHTQNIRNLPEGALPPVLQGPGGCKGTG
eukprot:gene21326-biopygen23628